MAAIERRGRADGSLLPRTPRGGRRLPNDVLERFVTDAPGKNRTCARGCVSRDYLDEHIKPELRIIRRGSKTILIPVAELHRWLEKSAARW